MGTFGAVPERVRSCREDFLDYLSKERPRGITDTEPASVSIEGGNYRLTAKKSGLTATVEIWQVYHSHGLGTRLPPRTRVCALNVSTQGVYFQGTTTSQITDPEKLLQIVFDCLQKGKIDSGLPVRTAVEKVGEKVAQTVAPQGTPRGTTLSYTSSAQGNTTFVAGQPLRPIAEPLPKPAARGERLGRAPGMPRDPEIRRETEDFDLLGRLAFGSRGPALKNDRTQKTAERKPELSELLVLDPGWRQGQPTENNLAVIMARFVMTAKPEDREYEINVVRNVINLAEAQGLGGLDSLRDRAWKVCSAFWDKKVLLDRLENGKTVVAIDDAWRSILVTMPEKGDQTDQKKGAESADINPKLKVLMALDPYKGNENPETNRAVLVIRQCLKDDTGNMLQVGRQIERATGSRRADIEVEGVFIMLVRKGIITKNTRFNGRTGGMDPIYTVASEWRDVLEKPAAKGPSAEKVKPTKEALLACDPAWDGRPGNNRAVLILEYLLNPKTERTRVKYFMIQQIAESRSRNSPRDYEQVKAALQSLVQKGIIIEKDTDRHESDRSYEVTPDWGEVLQGLEKRDEPSREALLACDPFWQSSRVLEANIASTIYRDLQEFGDAIDGDRESFLDDIADNYDLDRTKLARVFDAMVAKGIFRSDRGRFEIAKEWKSIQL